MDFMSLSAKRCSLSKQNRETGDYDYDHDNDNDNDYDNDYDKTPNLPGPCPDGH
jgi:hypothetical protein